MIIENLRTATRKAHRELDHYLIPRIKKTASPEDYRDLMSMFYSFYLPLEKNCDPWLSHSSIVPDYTSRRKAALILDDLREIGLNPLIVKAIPSPPPVMNLSQAMGCYYVYEGSTMGGTIISGMLAKVDALRGSLSFFSGYGSANEAMWKKFLISLESHEEELDEETLIKAAAQTFENLHQWSKAYYEQEHAEPA